MRGVSAFFGIMTGAVLTALITIVLGSPTVTPIGLYWTGVVTTIVVLAELFAFSFISANVYDFYYDEEDYNLKVAEANAREALEKTIRKIIKEECA